MRPRPLLIGEKHPFPRSCRAFSQQEARLVLPSSSFEIADSNRSWYRLEFNISPTKQTTEVLSNRSKSGVISTQIADPSARLKTHATRSIPPRLCSGPGSGTAGEDQPRYPCRKRMLLCPSTACACPPDLWRVGSLAQFPPYGVGVPTPFGGPLATNHQLARQHFGGSLLILHCVSNNEFAIRNPAKPLKT